MDFEWLRPIGEALIGVGAFLIIWAFFDRNLPMEETELHND